MATLRPANYSMFEDDLEESESESASALGECLQPGIDPTSLAPAFILLDKSARNLPEVFKLCERIQKEIRDRERWFYNCRTPTQHMGLVGIANVLAAYVQDLNIEATPASLDRYTLDRFDKTKPFNLCTNCEIVDKTKLLRRSRRNKS